MWRAKKFWLSTRNAYGLLLVLALTTAVAGACHYIGLALFQRTGVVFMWGSGAIPTAALLKSPRRVWPFYIIPIIVSQYSGNLPQDLNTGLHNAIGCYVVAFLFQAMAGRRPDFTRPVTGLRLAFAVAVIFIVDWCVVLPLAWRYLPQLPWYSPWLSSVRPVSGIETRLIQLMAEVFSVIAVTSAVGALKRRMFRTAEARLETVAIVIAIGLATAGIFLEGEMNWLFLLMAVSMAATLKGEIRGAAVSALAMVVSFYLAEFWAAQILGTPQALAPFVSPTTAIPIEAFLALTTLLSLWVGAGLHQRSRLQLQLARAKAEAERAAIIKAEFLANMSHDIRSPLGSVSLLAGELTRAGDLQPEYQQLAEQIQARSYLVVDLLNNILEFSRLEAGEAAIFAQTISVSTTIHQVMDMVRPAAETAFVQLLPAALEGPDRVVSDRRLIRRVIENLLQNAVKYAPGSQAQVRAQVREVAGQNHLRIEVIDSGPGIPETARDRLFLRFSQVRGSESTASGVGLGLSICRGIIDLLSGRIGYTAPPEGGSLFWFELPVGTMTDPS